MQHHRRVLIALLTILALFGLAQLAPATGAQETAPNVYLPALSKPIIPSVEVLSAVTAGAPSVGTYIVGEVINKTGADAYNIRINAHLSTPNGTVTVAGAALLPYLAPDQQAPYEVDISDIQTFFEYTVEAQWDTTSALTFQPITVVSANLSRGTGPTQITFALRNDGPQPVQNIRFAATIRSPGNALLDVTGLMLDQVKLNPGQLGLYTIEMFYAVPNAAQVHAQAQGEPFVPAPPTPTPVTPTPDPERCHPSYPTVCIPPPPPDLNCSDIPYRRFTVLPPDPHNFDTDHDGIGCESG